MAAAVLLDQAADFRNEGVPASPAAGWTRVYTKSDSGLYLKDSGGTERAVVTGDDRRLLGLDQQPGVTSAGQGALSLPTVNAGTAAITYTLAAADPVFVQDSGMHAIGFAGASGTWTPSPLPSSGAWRAYGVGINATGAVTWAAGLLSAVSADDAMRLLNISNFDNLLYLGYVVVKNTAGAYSLATYGSYAQPTVPVGDSTDRVVLASGDRTVDFGQTVFVTGTRTITLPDLYRLYVAPASFGAKVTITAGSGPVTIQPYRSTQKITLDGATTQTSYSLPVGATVELTATAANWFLALAASNRTTQLPPARAYRATPNQPALAPGWNKVLWNARDYDPGGYFDLPNSQYVCPAAGYYAVEASLEVGNGGSSTAFGLMLAIYKNGGESSRGNRIQGTGPATLCVNVADVIQCNAGDTLTIYAYNLDSVNTSSVGFTTIHGMSVVPVGNIGAPSPGQGITTAARAYRAGALSLTNSAWTPLAPDTKTGSGYDPGGNINGSGQYVCPATGYYQATGNVTVTTNTPVIVGIFKNGAEYSRNNNFISGQAVTHTDSIYCQAGDLLDVRAWQNTGTITVNVSLGSTANYLDVVQVGGTNLIGALSPTAQSADYGAGVGQLVLMTGSHAVTLPSAPMAGSQVAVNALTGIVTINRGGGDTITTPIATAQTSFTVPMGSTATLTYLGGVWYVISSSATSLTPAAAAGDTTATPNQFIAMTGQHTVTLPNAPAAGTQVGIAALTATTMVNRGGTDTININGTAGQTAITVANGATTVLTYLGGVWYAVSQGGAGGGTQVQFAAHSAAAVLGSAAAEAVVALSAAGDYDSGGFFNNATNRFQPGVAGYYHIDAGVISVAAPAASSFVGVSLHVNGALVPNGVGREASNPTGGMGYVRAVTSGLVYLNGSTDYVQLYGACVTSANAQDSTTTFTGWMTGFLASGIGSPSPGQGITTVARFLRSGAATVATSWNKVACDLTTFDAGANVTSNNKYTAPVSGYYQVDANISVTTNATNQSIGCAVYKNGATAIGKSITGYAASAMYATQTVSDIVYLQAGDYLELFAYSSGATPSLIIENDLNFLAVIQVAGTNLVGALSPTAQTADYTAGPGQSVLMTGAHTVTLPSAPMAGSQVQVTALTGSVVVNRAGTDTMSLGGQSTQITTTVSVGQTLTLMYLGGAWYGLQSGGSGGGTQVQFAAHNSVAAQLGSASAVTKVALNTKDYDSGGFFDIVNYRFKPGVPGYYQISFGVRAQSSLAAGDEILLYLKDKNGAAIGTGLVEATAGTSGSGMSPSPVGGALYYFDGATDYVELWGVCWTSGGGQAANTFNGWMTGHLAAGIGSPSPGQGVQTQARASRAAALNTVSGFLAVALDTKTFDPGSNIDLTNNGRYVCPVTGFYQVNAELYATATTSGQVLQASINKNGSRVVAGPAATSQASGGFTSAVGDIISCQAGDYLELSSYSTAVLAIANFTFMSVVQVGGANVVGALSPTAQTADYTAGAGQCVLMTGAHAVTLPNAPMAGSTVEVVALTGTVTINRAGTDTINVRGTGAQTTCSITSGCNLTLQYLGGVWYVIDGSQTLTPSPWIVIGSGGSAPAFQNSWTNLGGAGIATAAYMKDALGFVHLRGIVKSGASGTVAFTLPAGYRPGVTDWQAAAGWTGATPTPAFAGWNASGDISIFGAAGFANIGLGGVNFLAEN